MNGDEKLKDKPQVGQRSFEEIAEGIYGGRKETNPEPEEDQELGERKRRTDKILTNLDSKLSHAKIDPHIPWLGNRRLQFIFH